MLCKLNLVIQLIRFLVGLQWEDRRPRRKKSGEDRPTRLALERNRWKKRNSIVRVCDQRCWIWEEADSRIESQVHMAWTKIWCVVPVEEPIGKDRTVAGDSLCEGHLNVSVLRLDHKTDVCAKEQHGTRKAVYSGDDREEVPKKDDHTTGCWAADVWMRARRKKRKELKTTFLKNVGKKVWNIWVHFNATCVLNADWQTNEANSGGHSMGSTTTSTFIRTEREEGCRGGEAREGELMRG